MKRSSVILLVGVLVGGLTLAYLAGPKSALISARQAVVEKDVSGLKEVVDFPAFREQVKAQIMAEATSNMASETDPNSAAGMAMGMALVGAMVDGMLTAESIVAIASESPQDQQVPAAQWKSRLAGSSETDFTAFDKAEVMFVDEDSPGRLVILLELRGLSWKIVGARVED